VAPQLELTSYGGVLFVNQAEQNEHYWFCELVETLEQELDEALQETKRE